MFDRIFGEVVYDYGWCKPETIELFNKSYQITCVASAYKNEMISREQRAQYKNFNEHKNDILMCVEECLTKYVQSNHPDYFDTLKDCIVPKELIINQDGKSGIMFDCEWDVETGVIVGISSQIEVINPDCFL